MKKVMKAVAALMLMTAVVFTAGCKKEDNAYGDGTINGHTYVDLGLPSGTLWAACNVGASSPEAFGDYFAWGETQPKDRYDWNSYRYCVVETIIDTIFNNYGFVEEILNKERAGITKYCTDAKYGYNGYYDGFTVLLPNDDAATENWGGGWVTPTKQQWKELLDNTTSIWTMQNDVKGRLFTATNGCSLFLPAAGRLRADEEDNLVGDFGGYMSSTLQVDYSPYNPNWTWVMAFDSYGRGMNECLRFIGIPVRPVRSAN